MPRNCLERIIKRVTVFASGVYTSKTPPSPPRAASRGPRERTIIYTRDELHEYVSFCPRDCPRSWASFLHPVISAGYHPREISRNIDGIVLSQRSWNKRACSSFEEKKFPVFIQNRKCSAAPNGIPSATVKMYVAVSYIRYFGNFLKLCFKRADIRSKRIVKILSFGIEEFRF